MNLFFLNPHRSILGLDLKFHGPFHCLNHKVDLTRDEAENTLFQRQDQLEQYAFATLPLSSCSDLYF